ncbi:TonB-dependent receptor [Testudinibacter sp. TR-2022]|uniref:TonB-dependent receptor n=1 Tax=Testudinibacter sp. TR-2022 TaxID=2585029 RepID=UPI001117BE4F|nr:TonB-dependent receptor [Testudinibacter sp. TR-2022]TNH08401.1 TonB-dependent receptor [Pasteurellaceae bacterium Phil11]TNH20869.1 TonB-dependent receptor [Testudinibacter sp. TR-2022]TNH28103.1 TonB-dependent receptor [Testudinibacter sp. TR-2022]
MLFRLTPCALVVSGCIFALNSPSLFAAVSTTEQQLDEIIVSGEKSERSKFETSASLDVVTAKELQQAGEITSTTDLLKQTVNILDTGLGNDLPTVRGVDGSGPATGATAFFAGTRPRLNMSIDGRTSTYNELAFGTKSLWDIKQIEIYRGAQSYAQGRNAIAGAVVMTSNDPSYEWEGAAKLNVGSQNTRQTAAMISGPLIRDELAFRLSVDQQQRESFVNLISYEPVGNPRWYKTTTARAKLLWTPSALPDFYSRVTLNHIDSKAPQNEAGNQPVSNMRFTPQRPVFETGSTSGIWDIGWQLSDVWKFENKFVYSKYDNNRLALPAPTGAPATLEGRELQLEPIVKFKTTDGKYSGLIGLFYFQAKQDETVDIRIFHNVFKDKTKTKAIFAETTYAPNPYFDVTLSARYEQERHQRHGGSDLFRINLDKKHSIFLPKMDLGWNLDEKQRLGFKIGRGYNPGGAGVTFASPFTGYEYEAEYVWNYELYHRWNSPNSDFSLSSNLFYNDYKDMQLPYYLSADSVVIRNADKVITYGMETNADWQVSDNLNLHAAVGLLKTKIKKYPDSGIQGNKLSRSPSYTVTLGGRYHFLNHWEFGGSVYFVDDYYSNADNSSIGKIKGYSQVNAYLAYNFKQGRVMLYADNVFNARNDIFMPTTDRGEAFKLQPRVIGLSTEVRF